MPLNPVELLRLLRAPSQRIAHKDWHHDPERVSAAQSKRERRQKRNLRNMGPRRGLVPSVNASTDRRARPATVEGSA